MQDHAGIAAVCRQNIAAVSQYQIGIVPVTAQTEYLPQCFFGIHVHESTTGSADPERGMVPKRLCILHAAIARPANRSKFLPIFHYFLLKGILISFCRLSAG
jgi:hypothetical protein